MRRSSRALHGEFDFTFGYTMSVLAFSFSSALFVTRLALHLFTPSSYIFRVMVMSRRDCVRRPARTRVQFTHLGNRRTCSGMGTGAACYRTGYGQSLAWAWSGYRIARLNEGTCAWEWCEGYWGCWCYCCCRSLRDRNQRGNMRDWEKGMLIFLGF